MVAWYLSASAAVVMDNNPVRDAKQSRNEIKTLRCWSFLNVTCVDKCMD